MLFKVGVSHTAQTLNFIKPETIRDTESYRHVPYSKLMAMTRKTAKAKWDGLNLVKEEYCTNKNATLFTGMLHFEEPGHEDMTRYIGVSSSSNGQRSVKFAVGNSVAICLNGMVIGDVVTSRKHTINVMEELEERLIRAMESGKNKIQYARHLQEELTRKTVEPDEFAAFVGQGFMNDVFSPRQIKVVKDMYKVGHGRFGHYDKTNAFGTYGIATEAIQSNISPAEVLQKVKLVEEFTTGFFGVAA